MGQFEFKGILVSGEEIRGQRSARSGDRLRLLLANEGIIAVEITESAKSNSIQSLASLGNKRFLVPFTRQLAVMLRNSMRLDAIFRVLQAQHSSTSWQIVLRKIANNLNDGYSLSESLSLHPGVFDRFYVSLVRAG